MPPILYGTAWKKDKTSACVQKALTLGYRGFDTACQPKHYFEPGVGDGISSFLQANRGVKRADLFIQTKFTPLSGQDPNQLPYDPKAPIELQVAQSFETSLRNLQTNYVDSLVLHSPLHSEAQTRTVWRAMEALVEQGGVHQIGISNCYDPVFFEKLHSWAHIKPAVLQNRFYADSGYDVALRKFCQAHEVIYQSFWTLTANPQLLAGKAVTNLAAKYGKTPPQILFRYLSHEGVVPLTGAQSESHMREDLAIFEFELSEAERAEITGLLK